MTLQEYTVEAYKHYKNNDIENVSQYIETYINTVKNSIIANTPEFCDYNYIKAKYLFDKGSYIIAKDYISASMISYNTSHLAVEFQEILALYIDICGHLHEYHQIIKIFETYNSWNLNNREVYTRVIYWMFKLKFPNNTYVFTLYNKLKVKFNGSQFIINNYSEVMQDMFVLTILNGKRNGKYLELGAAEFNENNNTYLLETLFSWEGISVEYDYELVKSFNANRKNKCIYADAIKLDYEYLIKERLDSNRIDYLQVDLDPAKISLEALKKVINSNVRFSIITFEHDDYYYINEQTQNEAKEFLENNGYVRIVKGINAKNIYTPFEDWYIDSQIINENIQKIIDKLNENYTGDINSLFYSS